MPPLPIAAARILSRGLLLYKHRSKVNGDILVTPHERTRAAAPDISGKETRGANHFFNHELNELLITSKQNSYNVSEPLRAFMSPC